jgi:hypothetical protein
MMVATPVGLVEHEVAQQVARNRNHLLSMMLNRRMKARLAD